MTHILLKLGQRRSEPPTERRWQSSSVVSL